MRYRSTLTQVNSKTGRVEIYHVNMEESGERRQIKDELLSGTMTEDLRAIVDKNKETLQPK